MVLSKFYALDIIKFFREILEIEDRLRKNFGIEISHTKTAYTTLMVFLIIFLIEAYLPLVGFIYFSTGQDYFRLICVTCISYITISSHIIQVQFCTVILLFNTEFSAIRNFLLKHFGNLPLHNFIPAHDGVHYADVLRKIASVHQDLSENLRKFNKLLSIELLMSFAYLYLQFCIFVFSWILLACGCSQVGLIFKITFSLWNLTIFLTLVTIPTSSHLCINEVIMEIYFFNLMHYWKLFFQIVQLTRVLYKLSNLKSTNLRIEVNTYID